MSNYRKQDFLNEVKSWATTKPTYRSKSLELDKELYAQYNNVCDARDELAALCKRKLEEAGIK